MYTDRLYQIEEQNEFQLIVKAVTLETATDVTYEKSDIIEIFGGGSFAEWVRQVKEDTVLFQTYLTGSWDKDRTVYMVFLQAIIRAVQKELERNPKATVELDLDSHHISRLTEINRLFKQHGFMLRPKFGHFVKYKEPKAKPKKASGILLHTVRSAMAGRVMDIISDRLEGSFSLNGAIKKTQIGAVRLAKIVGIEFDDVMLYNKQGYCGNLYEYIKKQCKDEPEVAELTIQEIKNWWKENWTTKFEPQK